MSDELLVENLAQQHQRAIDNEQRRWVEAIIGQTVDKAARAVHAERGDALLVWIDPNGELQARRISREQSTIREYVPKFLQR